jgi:hypothetical protein
MDVRASSLDDHHFIFEDTIDAVTLALCRDASIARETRQGLPNDETLGAYAGIVPFQGISLFVAPLCYLYHHPALVFAAVRALYVRFFWRLHSAVADGPRSLTALVSLAFSLVDAVEPALAGHMAACRRPLEYELARWIATGFGLLPPTEWLLLWDRVLAYDSPELLAVTAAALLVFKSGPIMGCGPEHVDDIDAMLSDLGGVRVVPLLQSFLH